MQQSKPEWAIRFHRRINLGEHPRYRAPPSLPELPLLRGCLPTRNNTASGSDSSLSPRDEERERETPLIRRRRRMRFNIGWPVRGRGQLGKGSWSRWDTRTYDPRPLLVPLTNVSWHPPGHGPPPRGPPSSLNSRLGCIRDTGTRAQPNPESPLLPETVETVQLLAGLCSCLVIAYYLKGEGWYLKRYAKRVFLFFFFFEVMFFLWSFRVLFSNSSLRSLYSLSFKIFLI